MSAEPKTARPFKTPLAEVSAQIDLSTSGLVEFRARSFYDTIKEEYPRTQRLPVILVGEPLPNQAVHLPAYRFFSADGKCAVQLGPRMVSVNALSWDMGFEGYRKTAHSIVDRYARAMPDELVIGYTLGFYNRIPTADIEEARRYYDLDVVKDDILFDELSYQSLRNTRAGLIVTQVAAAQPDERMNEKHLIVNNIVRCNLGDDQHSVKDVVVHWREWLEVAHEVAKEVFWNSLTQEAQNLWLKTVPK
jgi:uncharacterized protein (TIGR04255 family)